MRKRAVKKTTPLRSRTVRERCCAAQQKKRPPHRRPGLLGGRHKEIRDSIPLSADQDYGFRANSTLCHAPARRKGIEQRILQRPFRMEISQFETILLDQPGRRTAAVV